MVEYPTIDLQMTNPCRIAAERLLILSLIPVVRYLIVARSTTLGVALFKDIYASQSDSFINLILWLDAKCAALFLTNFV